MNDYLFVQKINDRQEIVLDPSTHQLARRKYLSVYDEDVYNFLLNHHHPNIVSILSVERKDDILIVVEKEIEGKTLRQYLDEKILTEKEKEIIFDEIMDGIEFLHKADPPIIHRDLKPENIMITSHRVVKIIDFNAAKVSHKNQSRDTVLIGTEGIAAPEQYGFGESDERTDIYALGKLAEILFPQKKQFIAKATALDPDDRYQSIAELRKAFHNPLIPYGWYPFHPDRPSTIIRFLIFQLLFLWICTAASALPTDRVCVWLMCELLYMLFTRWTPLFHIMSVFDNQPFFVRLLLYAFVAAGIVFLSAALSLLFK